MMPHDPDDISENEPRMATMYDVAARAGVAMSSVSRTLSGHPAVSRRMRTRVLDAASALGYEPDLLAQSLRRGTTNTVGFVVRDIANPLFSLIATGAERILREAGYVMLLSNSDGLADVEAANVSALRRRRVDGLIISPATTANGSLPSAATDGRTPVVVLDRDVDGSTASAVLTDHLPGVTAATNELLDAGHTRLAVVTGPVGTRPSRERIRGVRDAVELRGLDPESVLVAAGSFAADFAAAETTRLLGRRHPPSAIVAGGLQSAIGALDAIAASGRRLGRDVAFVACDDFPLFTHVDPAISVVQRDPVHIGAVAAELLLGACRGAAPRTVVLATTFVSRQSTR